jgi:type III pantothenate kinase
MLLAIDVGNTNTVLGVFEGDRLLDNWRMATWEARTADEYSIALRSLLEMSELGDRTIDAGILASVVPGVVQPILWALERRFGLKPLVVGPGIKTGMPILYENPKEVGADRIVNAVAAYAKYRGGAIVVDFGTATTFDCISPQGEYLGGVITPGVTISADALYRHAAKLPRVEVRRPGQVIGRNTVASIQAGLYHGYIGLVDGIVRRMMEECGFPVRVVATGGLASLIAGGSATIEEVDEHLTLAGMKLIHDLNMS